MNSLSSFLQMAFLYRPVSLVDSQKVLLKDKKFGQVFEENVIREKGLLGGGKSDSYSSTSDSYFINKKNKYVWDETVQLFRKLRNIDEGLNQSDFFKMQVELGRYCQCVPRYQYNISQGLSSSEVRARILEYGENFIKISVPPVLHLVIHEGLNPFFLFQGSPQPQDFEFCRTFDISCFIPSN